MTVIEINPPNRNYNQTGLTVFLAGSIEMGKAVDWQSNIISTLRKESLDRIITVFNPRRPDWNNSWSQTREDANFNDQVNWELEHLEKADIVLFYFDKNTKSPISMLELGLCMKDKRGSLIVACPPEFYKFGNIDITCEFYDVPLIISGIVDCYDGAIDRLLDKIEALA